MDLIIGIILLISYFGLIYYAARGGNLMIGFFIMAVTWGLLSIFGGELGWNGFLNNIMQSGPESWGATAVNVIFGSWFGRILIDTGIASKLIKSVTELGGDDPLIVTILLSIVSGIIFTATFGAGAVVAIGVIILPILMSLGVSKVLAVSSYLMSVGSGMYINSVLFSQMQMIFSEMEYDGQYLKWAFAAMAVQLFVIAIMVWFNMRGKNKRKKAWAMKNPADIETEEKGLPGIALITPIIPTALAILFEWPTIPAFIIGGLFGLAVSGELKDFKTLSRIIPSTFYEGVLDVASLLGFLFILPMFNSISGVAAPFFEPLIGWLIPGTAFGLAILFMIIAPFGLFRGPLTIFGAGAATVGVLQVTGDFSTPLLFAMMYVPTIVMNLSTGPTQSWNLWALNYSKVSVNDFLKQNIVWAWLIAILNIFLAYIIFG